MARRHRGTKKRSSSSRRRGQRGGGAGIGGYTFGGPITPGAPVGNTAEVLPMDSCQAVQRFGLVSQSTGAGTGLPGMRGGKRGPRGTKRRGTKRGPRVQRGGRYGFDLSAPVAPAAPWAGGIPQVMKIPCEAARPNPLNAQAGGAPGGIGSPYYVAPTAGYTNTASPWVGSTGAPSLIQTPYAAQAMNAACLKTGGGKRRQRRHRRGTKKH